MTQPIDEVYVDIHARGEEKAARDVERAARQMQVDVDTAAKNITISFERAADDIADSLERGARDAGDAVGDLADDVSNEMDRVSRKARDAGDSIGKSFGGGAGAGGAGLLESLSTLGAQLRNISALAPPPIFLALAAALPAVLALGGAVADLSALLLLLPAGIGALVSSVAALQLAFSGVGDAVKALATGDLEKINEAMKQLAPSAQAFAREVFALKGPLEELKKSVQEAFFAPLRGDLTQLARNVLPTVREGLSQISGAFGEFGSQLFDLLGSNDIIQDLGVIFRGTANIISNLTPSIINLLGTLFGVAEKGMPFLERAFDALGQGFDKLAGFLSEAMASGDFQRWLEDAFQIMSDLGDLTKSVFSLLSAVFGDMGDEGSTFIQTLADMTQQLANFFNSAEGQAVLQRLVDTLPLLMQAFAVGIGVLAAFAVYTEMTFRSLEWLGQKVVDVATVIGEFFGNFDNWATAAWDAVTNFFTGVGTFFGSIGTWVTNAYNAVATFVAALFNWVTNVENIGYAIGYAIGLAIKWFFNLREWAMDALNALIGFVIQTFIGIQQTMINITTSVITAVIDFFFKLPERIGAALTWLWNTVTSLFNRTRDSATSRTRSLFNTVVGFFRDLPPRVMAFITGLPGRIANVFQSIVNRMRAIGGNILRGLIDGLRNGFSSALNTAQDIARGILNGMKDALGIGSPSKLAAIEVGRPIMQGVGIGAQDEVMNVRHTLNSAVVGALPGVAGATTGTGGGTGGQTVTFTDGAVQVIFQGAVPTEAEALRTGQTVGAGIAQTLARRNVRTAVRIA